MEKMMEIHVLDNIAPFVNFHLNIMEPSSKSISIYFQQGKRAPTLSGHVALHIKVCLSGRTCQDWSAQTEAESAAKLYWCNLYISIYELLLSLSLHCFIIICHMSLHVIAITVIQLQYMQCIYIYIIDIYTYIQILYIYTYLYIQTLLYVHYILYIHINFQQLQSTPSLPQCLRAHLSHLRLEAHVQHPVGLRGFPNHWTGEMIQILICLIRDIHGEYPSNNFTKHWDMDLSRWGVDKKGIEHGCRTKIPVVKMVL